MGKERNGSRFEQKRVSEMSTGRPFVVPGMGVYAWVVPPFIDGAENAAKKRVLCTIRSEKNGTTRMCAVAVRDESLVRQLKWQVAISLNGLKGTFGTATNKPEVFIDQVTDSESHSAVPVRHFLDKKGDEALVETTDAQPQKEAGH